jgi:hypothetical protein
MSITLSSIVTAVYAYLNSQSLKEVIFAICLLLHDLTTPWGHIELWLKQIVRKSSWSEIQGRSGIRRLG